MTHDPNSSWLTLVMHELRTPLTAATGYLELAHTMARQVRTAQGAQLPHLWITSNDVSPWRPRNSILRLPCSLICR